MMDKPSADQTGNNHDELYEEPQRLSGHDLAGVAAALVALVVIGLAGYVWLTPELSFTDLPAVFRSRSETPPPATGTSGQMPHDHGMPAVSGSTSAVATPSGHDDGQQPGQNHTEAPAAADARTDHAVPEQGIVESTAMENEAADNTDPLAAPHTHTHDLECAYCGMASDRSLSPVVAAWDDGSHTHHDCWDCVFNHGSDSGLELQRAAVLIHGSPPDAPLWLDAAAAWYLYETKPIKGSMPPYVAAFASRDAAQAAQPGLSGEVVDFTGLKAKWGS